MKDQSERHEQGEAAAFHTATMSLIDRYPALSWAVAREDFWRVMADFRVQCLPGYVVED